MLQEVWRFLNPWCSPLFTFLLSPFPPALHPTIYMFFIHRSHRAFLVYAMHLFWHFSECGRWKGAQIGQDKSRNWCWKAMPFSWSIRKAGTAWFGGRHTWLTHPSFPALGPILDSLICPSHFSALWLSPTSLPLTFPAYLWGLRTQLTLVTPSQLPVPVTSP